MSRRFGLLSALVLCHCIGAPAAPLTVPTSRDDLPSRLEKEIPRLMREAEIPGLSVAVVRDGKLYWSGAFGVRDVATGAPVRRDTVFAAASLSKPVVAYIVLRLADRGTIDLDRPLSTYFTYERLSEEKRAGLITARMVLTHSTGLPNWGPDKLSLSFAPGTHFSYSGEGFVYLQKVIEKLTGMPLQDLARREVFEPLGMKHTSFVWEDAFATGDGAVVGVDDIGGAATISTDKVANAASSLLTTAEDYARFLTAVLIQGEGLKKETAAAMLSPQILVPGQLFDPASPPGDGEVAWGLGCGLERSRAAEPFWFWHWGDNGGFRNWMTGSRERRSGVVYFTNSAEGLSIAEAVSSLAVGEPQPAFGRLEEYERYNLPRRVARRELQRVFAKEGSEAGLRRFRELQAKSPEQADARLGIDLASFLSKIGKNADAYTVLQLSAAAHPGSPETQEKLGEAALGTGDYGTALAAFRKATALRPADADLRRSLQWTQAAIEAQKSPAALPAEALGRFVGNYGARHILLTEGTLYYHRDGRPSYRLLPLSADTFLLQGNGAFRLRFVTGGDGQVSKLVVLYLDGSQDESPRGSG